MRIIISLSWAENIYFISFIELRTSTILSLMFVKATAPSEATLYSPWFPLMKKKILTLRTTQVRMTPAVVAALIEEEMMKERRSWPDWILQLKGEDYSRPPPLASSSLTRQVNRKLELKNYFQNSSDSSWPSIREVTAYGRWEREVRDTKSRKSSGPGRKKIIRQTLV